LKIVYECCLRYKIEKKRHEKENEHLRKNFENLMTKYKVHLFNIITRALL